MPVQVAQLVGRQAEEVRLGSEELLQVALGVGLVVVEQSQQPEVETRRPCSPPHQGQPTGVCLKVRYPQTTA
jgi:hypothetical protein